MIFSAFGNVPNDFSRLAAALDEYAGRSDERIVVQCGHTRYPFQHVEAIPFLPQDEFRTLMLKADLLVLHGGWGTISEALDAGCRIVAVPRRMPEEHNHPQEDLVRKLESLECLLGVYDINTLPAVIELAKTCSFKTLARGRALPFILHALQQWDI